MNDPTLFDVPSRPVQDVRGLARYGDPETSRAAAASISKSCEAAIQRLFALPRALCDDEICELLPEWHPPTVKSARSRLSKAGVLVDSGERRSSVRGARMIVWERA